MEQRGAFWGLIGAAVVGVAGYIGYKEYEHRRDVAEAQAMVVALGQGLSSAVRSVEARPLPRPRDSGRPLQVDERCVGGVVIVVSGSSYTQAGERCAGRFTVPR